MECVECFFVYIGGWGTGIWEFFYGGHFWGIWGWVGEGLGRGRWVGGGIGMENGGVGYNIYTGSMEKNYKFKY